MRNKGCLDLCTNKLLGEFFELDSPCVIELFSGIESEAWNAARAPYFMKKVEIHPQEQRDQKEVGF